MHRSTCVVPDVACAACIATAELFCVSKQHSISLLNKSTFLTNQMSQWFSNPFIKAVACLVSEWISCLNESVELTYSNSLLLPPTGLVSLFHFIAYKCRKHTHQNKKNKTNTNNHLILNLHNITVHEMFNTVSKLFIFTFLHYKCSVIFICLHHCIASV